MNSSRQMLTVAIAVPLALCAIRPAKAQTPSSRSPQGFPLQYHDTSDAQVQQHVIRAQAQALSAVDVATFQANLQSLVNWLSQTATKNPNQQAQISDLQTQINNLTSDQMTQLANSFDAAAFNTAVTIITSTQPATPTLPSTDPPANLFPVVYGPCAPTAGPPAIPSDPGTIHALLIAIEVAKGADVVAGDACSSFIDILGEGTNLPGCIVKLIADLILFGLQTAHDQMVFCDSNDLFTWVDANWQNTIVIDTDIANLAGNTTNSFTQVLNQLTTVNTDVDNHISSIAGNTTAQFTQVNNQLTAVSTSLSKQTTAVDVDVDSHIAAIDVDLNNHLTNVDADVKNTTTAIDTDIGNHLNQVDTDVLKRDTQIDTEIGTLQTLALRLKIEHVLAAALTLELFEVPQAQGGYLETVRAIVSDIISKLLAAGQTVGTATKWLALGDAALAAKQYKTAYQDYSAAYQTAVK
jgi:hypothetical protein